METNIEDILNTNTEELNLGAQSDFLKRIKDEREIINKISSELTHKLQEAEHTFIEACAEAGTVIARGKIATATISEEIIPGPDINWDLFYKYIIKNNAPYMLYKRITLAPIREIWSTGINVPGVTKITQKKVSTRKL